VNFRDKGVEERVLVLMPSERDTERTLHLLTDANLPCTACADVPELCRELRRGAGAVLLTDEMISADLDRYLEEALRQQSAWSALPILLLAREGTGERMQRGTLGAYNSVIVVERPVRTRSLVSAVQSALRARRNQYQIRDAIREHERQAAELMVQEEKLQRSRAELAAYANQLRTADRRKDEFLATLAHELRNPLAPISTGLSLLADSSNPELSRRTLGVMQRQVRHMVRLIDDLLDVSRITTGKLELKRERIAVASVVEAAIEGSLPNLERAQIKLRLDVTDEQLFLDADHTRIAQVLSNLLNNSSKYTANDGSVVLSVRRDGDHVRIAVRDNGLGFPEECIEDIFQMFGQVNRALDRSHGGLGIGLALVRKLVEMHGGTVDAYSAGPNQGSTFTVRLPLADGAPARVNGTAVQMAPKPTEKRVLVVDDNDDAAELLALMLERGGYQTMIVHDGPAAIDAAHSLIPDIVILDIGLPGITGYEVAEQLRADRSLSDTALIALTGWGAPDDRRKALESGFDVHLTKPVTAEDLHDALERASLLRQRAVLSG
jgi:signal transduction histidine kinase/ActR/RegA family two-component response regulator